MARFFRLDAGNQMMLVVVRLQSLIGRIKPGRIERARRCLSNKAKVNGSVYCTRSCGKERIYFHQVALTHTSDFFWENNDLCSGRRNTADLDSIFTKQLH